MGQQKSGTAGPPLPKLSDITFWQLTSKQQLMRFSA